MSDKRFDYIIRSKLADYNSDIVPDWKEFKRKKETGLILDDHQLDQRVKSTLENFEHNKNPLNWETLYTKFQQRIYLRNQVFAIKTGELLILLLCIFTFMNYFDSFILPSESRQQAETLQIAVLDGEAYDFVSEIIHEPADLNAEKSQSDFHSSSISQQSLVQTAEVGNANSVAELNQKNISAFILDTEGESLTVANETGKPEVNSVNEFVINEAIKDFVRLSPIDSRLKRMSSIPSINLSNEVFNNNKNNESSDWFQLSTSINNNTINSPRDVVYNLDEQVLYTPGFSLTALYSHMQSNVEYGIGLSYSRISYAPYPIKESYQSEDGINVASLNNIEYDIVSIPVISRIHFINNVDWSMFATIGVQTSLVIDEYYDITDELDVPLPRPPSSSTSKYRSRLSEKEFTRAVFNGGKFSENIFVHGQLGFGVQRNLSKKTCLYLSGEYSHHFISPLGPNNDMINVFSFGAGLKIRI